MDFCSRLPESYDELYGLAERLLARRGPRSSVRATSLVHETYLRFARAGETPVRDEQHLLALAARAMRQVLIDRARRQGSLRAGGGQRRTAFEEGAVAAEAPRDDLLAVDEALGALAEVGPRKARVVELRFFGGLSVEETAGVLAVSPVTVKRDWAFARAWILRRIQAG